MGKYVFPCRLSLKSCILKCVLYWYLHYRQLLLDCGIGAGGGTETEVVVSPHRALIFCQLKGMLDIIEDDLLK